MDPELNINLPAGPRVLSRWAAPVCAAVLCLFTSGCLSPLAKHVKAFSDASDLVITNSESAYRAANDLRSQEQITASVYAYQKNPSWNPYTDPRPLLTPEQLQARITVLNGLKTYAASLTALTGKPPADLDSAASGVGENLAALNTSVATDLSNSIPNIPVMDGSVQNGISTAVKALGEYLIAKKVRGSLPAITQKMNPSIVTLCEFLNSDIVVLRRQADADYLQLSTDQDGFIRHNLAALGPEQTRAEIRILLTIVSQQKANDLLLSKLQKSLHTLELTHQALAAAAQGNNPASLQQNIALLVAAGEDLGNYYNTLQTAATSATASTSTAVPTIKQ